MGSLRSLAHERRMGQPRSGFPIHRLNWRIIEDDPGFGEIVEEFRNDKKSYAYSMWRYKEGLVASYCFSSDDIKIRCGECSHITNSVFIRPDTKEITCIHCLNPYWGRLRRK
jgi:hypothetical protein